MTKCPRILIPKVVDKKLVELELLLAVINSLLSLASSRLEDKEVSKRVDEAHKMAGELGEKIESKMKRRVDG